jgi:hypothetical protein
VTASARCFAGERPPPLAPIAEWLRSGAFRPAIERLDPAWRMEVARLVPELGTEPPAEGTAAVHSGDTWYRHRFFEGLVRAVLGVGQPTALLLDDVQWCDLDTLTWLDLCLYRAAEAPLLVVTTVRAEEASDNPDLAALLGRLRASGAVVDVELGPLHEAETAELATLLVGPDADTSFLTRVQSLAGGFRCSSSRRLVVARPRATPIWTRAGHRVCRRSLPDGSPSSAPAGRSWPGWRRRSAATSRSISSPKRATWGPTPSSMHSTSCGVAGSSASGLRPRTTSRTTSSAPRRTTGSARPAGAACTDAWRRRWRCSTPTGSTPWRVRSPISTTAVASGRGRCPSTSRPSRRPPGCSRTARRCSSRSGLGRCWRGCPPGVSATYRSSGCARRPPSRATPSAAGRRSTRSGIWRRSSS